METTTTEMTHLEAYQKMRIEALENQLKEVNEKLKEATILLKLTLEAMEVINVEVL